MSDLLKEWTVRANSNNLFMMCKQFNQNACRPLPEGYHFRLCRQNELETWKRICAEEQYIEFVTDYYNKVYAPHEDEFFRRCTFVCNGDDKPVATCYIWRSYGKISTVGWYRVLPEYEGQGIGRALLGKVLKDAEYPIYLHTHPAACRAIKLYSDFGFMFLTDPVIGYRENNLKDSLPYLKTVLPKLDYSKLQTAIAGSELLEAALQNEMAEF